MPYQSIQAINESNKLKKKLFSKQFERFYRASIHFPLSFKVHTKYVKENIIWQNKKNAKYNPIQIVKHVRNNT